MSECYDKSKVAPSPVLKTKIKTKAKTSTKPSCQIATRGPSSFPFFGIIQIVFGKKFLLEMRKFSSVVGVLPFSPCRSSLFVEQSPMNGEYGRENEKLPTSKIHLVALEIIVSCQFYSCIVCIFILT